MTAVERIELDRYRQLAGDGLLIAVAQQASGAGLQAGRCATMLRDRRWDGDEALALELDAAVRAICVGGALFLLPGAG